MFRRLVSTSPVEWGLMVPVLVRHAAVVAVESLREVDDALVPLDDDVNPAT